MSNENRLRFILFIIVAAAHVIAILFLAVNVATVNVKTPEKTRMSDEMESARVMRLTDISELINEIFLPPPPPDGPPPLPDSADSSMVESIAEEMIETDVVPEQTIVAPGTLIHYGSDGFGFGSLYGEGSETGSWDDYLSMHQVSEQPVFDERDLATALVYPPIALRSGIEGRVILELFIDRNGYVQQILILQENPKDRGFGEAAIKAFTGKRGTPAMSDGKPVSCRIRRPVTFKIK